MQNWYVLYTKPNAEYQVATSLQRRGIQTYLPEMESPTGQKGREKKPFFPCYLFVRLDFGTIGLSHMRWTPGLHRVVAFDDRPMPLPEEVIDLIRRKLDGLDANSGWPAHTFQPGETVRFTHGPLQGMLAMFEGPSTPAERVRVLLSFLGQTSRAHVSAGDLEKAPAGAQVTAPRRPRRTRGRGRRIKRPH
jgi:transcriptional antiterminator RfaH